ncbi:UDP-N-acetylmuramoyl-L-alanyl-D-glutamate--2,6-diaminopimelate ligase [Actinomyces sp. B33]|uniref:UDP-N-acetylmuramoyl-L-alanyl-D-glutamate--2, 6-diaminopimelate ligase n=1 Tax=Actinomyces sp. B33 TaxID=2942131 RepID=UPI002340A5B3|nr:UDP-N-acetylmuramoyl-L-alanyl-D-glutamate--2,6-diaminopimelate ligase [Actinomyces sp. B33]MDC4233300.1 UDP-N-acetylmuramoyl-L-alanyl-D-glutamate--2,6-diaminopimelate ligase [Actinomyces sp. B33]
MASVVDIRPAVPLIDLVDALDGVGVRRFIGASGSDESLVPGAVSVRGVTVSSEDCDDEWAFVAIGGLVRHGARFSGAARRAGANVVVTDEAGAGEAHTASGGLPVVVVDDPRAAAAVISANVYRHPASRLTTMGVTGTNGKTTTSYLMRAALRARFADPALCGTIETRIGDLSFLSSRTTAEAPVVQRFLALADEKGLGAAVVEASSHAVSLHRIDGAVLDVVGFTNLQHDHLDYYGDMETYFEAKKGLFTPERALRGVVCVDDEWGRRLAVESRIPVATVSALTDEPADWMVRDTHPDPAIGRTVFTLVDPRGQGRPVAMPILGDVNVQNTALAIVSAVQIGLDVDEAIRAVEAADQIPGRMEKVNPSPGDEPLVIVDYAHTPEALEWTLRSTRELTRGRLVIVFGTDGDRDASKREHLAQVAARGADVLWVTDENPRTEDPQRIRDALMRGVASQRPGLEGVVEIVTSRRDAVRKAILAAGAGDTVIVTGKGAEWYQEVEGVKHAYNDVDVAREVLACAPLARM